MVRRLLTSTLFPYTTLFRSICCTATFRMRAAAACPRQKRLCTRAKGIFRSERRSEEHTSELQSLRQLVCRRLREKKKKDINGEARRALLDAPLRLLP